MTLHVDGGSWVGKLAVSVNVRPMCGSMCPIEEAADAHVAEAYQSWLCCNSYSVGQYYWQLCIESQGITMGMRCSGGIRKIIVVSCISLWSWHEPDTALSDWWCMQERLSWCALVGFTLQSHMVGAGCAAAGTKALWSSWICEPAGVKFTLQFSLKFSLKLKLGMFSYVT